MDYDFNPLVFIITLYWAILSLFFKSYRVPRVNSIVHALRPTFFTWFFFTLLYTFSTTFLFLPHLPSLTNGLYLFILGLIQHVVALARFIFFYQYRLRGKNIRQVLLISFNMSSYNFEKLRKDCLQYGYHISKRMHKKHNLYEKVVKIVSKGKYDFIFLKEGGENSSKKISKICDQYGIRLKLLLNMDIATGRKA